MNLRRIVLPVLVLTIAAGMAVAFALRSPSVLAYVVKRQALARFSDPIDASFQANKCCGEMSYWRATSDTTAPGAQDSATIRPLIASLQRRRRPTPT